MYQPWFELIHLAKAQIAFLSERCHVNETPTIPRKGNGGLKVGRKALVRRNRHDYPCHWLSSNWLSSMGKRTPCDRECSPGCEKCQSQVNVNGERLPVRPFRDGQGFGSFK